MIRITEIIAQYYRITVGKITAGCDSDSAMDSTVLGNLGDPMNKVKRKHLDLINSIRNLIQQTPINIQGGK